MKKLLLGLACLASISVMALENEPQFENDQICVSKVRIEAHEEVGLHRDVYPHIVIALKGGTITRLEADGQTNDINLPTGVAVFRKTDPENELHKCVNNSSEPIELVIIDLKNSAPLLQDKPEGAQDISVNIRINCPKSDELQNFVESIPSSDRDAASFDEWKSSFVKNMKELIHLVESEKVFNSFWSVSAEDTTPKEDKETTN